MNTSQKQLGHERASQGSGLGEPLMCKRWGATAGVCKRRGQPLACFRPSPVCVCVQKDISADHIFQPALGAQAPHAMPKCHGDLCNGLALDLPPRDPRLSHLDVARSSTYARKRSGTSNPRISHCSLHHALPSFIARALSLPDLYLNTLD